MPLIEYFLLALMGSGAAASGAAPGTPPNAIPGILGADAIIQPNGGALATGRNENATTGGAANADRRKRPRHRHGHLGGVKKPKRHGVKEFYTRHQRGSRSKP
jgi:hypothetical protein